ncbi:mRNA splicing factor, thioredoxin-like U5 snRNP [Artemisia annua]|uniref:mRNA splicing factor, thioredoxin-like U5 snRNP n=1 Tax=Artemisia annua TaxID=35608 RepID=A0A2U1KBU2_ARTAN|nr:mRNA splicing factor, thioredoxin-like U5 snRNP [Artemisia annua]
MQVHLGDTPNHLTEGDFEALARKTKGFFGSDITICVKDVLYEPVLISFTASTLICYCIDAYFLLHQSWKTTYNGVDCGVFVMRFFFRNKHIMIDLGTSNNNKINWVMKDKQEFINIVETVNRGARKGRGLVIAPKNYSTKYRY